MKIANIRQRLRELGTKPDHEERILRNWTRALPLEGGRSWPENFLPLEVRKALPALAAEWQAFARLRSKHAGADAGRPFTRISIEAVI